MPELGAKTNAKPWPGRKWGEREMEKMKEVEKGRGWIELWGLVGIECGYRALPIEKVVALVKVRVEDWMVELPWRRRDEELKVLKMKSRAEMGWRWIWRRVKRKVVVMRKDYMVYSQAGKIFNYAKKVKDVEEELNTHISPEDILVVSKLNACQMEAYKIIMKHVRDQEATAFFIYGPGFIALATASSGIVASNLPGDQMEHSRFKIPLENKEILSYKVDKQTSTATLIKHVRLIIWDEAFMALRQNVETVETML
ncbi:hypothetical protein RJ640_029220 [Escallonia rubra]|uniref:ATP-dependent DNA helicase n=1 Tax=Escallonia rubra TaxID=112253 RepID=A0AA88RCN0_9ASTE|nr:hypothetical protein RJ640_029220 [Escallonia rubra]